jgi:capsular polysaccharide transport system permease protein
MTTKPTKARKFRIKRNSPAAPASTEEAAQPQQVAQGEGRAADQLRQSAQASTQPRTPPNSNPAASGQAGEVASPQQVAGETDIDAIRREGLTGRQLRMARRVAQKHGLAATSDFDAVRLLRAQGIDPFQRSNTLELVVPQNGADGQQANPAGANLPAKQAGGGKVQLPQTMQMQKQTLPSTDVNPAERRIQEIANIQRGIAARRR